MSDIAASVNSIEKLCNFFEGAFVLVDSKGDLLSLNSKACLLLGIEVGANLFSNLSGFSGLDFDLADLELGERKEIFRPESKHFPALFIELYLFQRYPTDQKDLFLFILKNVTEKRLDERLKGDFLALISHKMRTPVVALNYAMNLFQRRHELGFTEEQSTDFIEQARFKSVEMASIVEKILLFLTFTQEKNMALEEESHLLAPLIQEVCEEYRLLNGAYRFPFELKLSISPEIKVQFPKLYLKTIVENLIDNSIKFNDSRPIFVWIEAEVDSPLKVLLRIRDNGLGIPNEYHEKVFEPFFQIEKHFSGSTEGLGIGLTLVKHLLDGFGESISISSLKEGGTEVVCSFPGTVDVISSRSSFASERT